MSAPINQIEAEMSLCNLVAERRFVACLMARPDWIGDAAQQVPPNWLHYSWYRAVYDLMLRAYWLGCTQGWTPRFDPESLHQYAVGHGVLEEFSRATRNFEAVRDAHLMASGAGFIPDQAIRPTVNDLRQSALRVQTFRRAAKLQADILASADPAQALATAQNDLMHLSAGLSPSQGIQSVGDGDLCLNRAQGVRPSHLPKLNDLTGGFRPGTLSIMCARTNVGKSVFMGSIALDAAVEQGIPTLILDTEMGRDQMLRRAVSWRTGLDENRLFIHGGYENDPASRQQADAAKDAIKAAPLFHVSIGSMDMDQAAFVMRQFRRCFIDTSPARQGLVVYDYLKATSGQRVPEWQVLGDLAMRLRNLAIEIDLPVIAGMQGGRQALRMAQADYANEGIGIATGSDRPAHHSDLFCTLRNLNDAEARNVAQRFSQSDAEHARNRLRFNQVLHVNKQRSGPTFEQGMPLLYTYGQSRYLELAYRRGADGQPLMEHGRRIDSEEMQFLHSREFQRRGEGKAGSVPQARLAG